MGLLDRAVDKLKSESKVGSTESAPPDSIARSMAAPRASDPGRTPPAAPPSSGETRMGGRVTLDLPGLAQRGFVVPGYPCDNILLDEYRRIKRQLLFRTAVHAADGEPNLPGNLIMVTSALDGEGKTFVSTNLAFSVSLELDRSALLIDADVIRRGASRLLGLEQHKGLVDYLRGDIDDLADLLVVPEGLDNLQILPTGGLHKNVNELLASERMGELLDRLAEEDPDRIVIFDTPPLLMTSEASVLAQQAGQIALVVRADHTAQHHVEHALGLIPSERFSGIILNAATRSLAQDGYADYYYGDT